MHRGKPFKVFELVLIIALVLGIRALSRADALGGIDGTATAGARINVICGSVVRGATADSAGHFAIAGLPAGTCTVTASASGHTSVAVKVTVRASATSSLALRMPSAPVAPEEKAADKAKTEVNAPMTATAAPPPPPAKPSPSMRMHVAGGYVSQPIMQGPAAISMDQDPAHDTESYARIDDNPFQRTQTKPLSTFSVDVDTASYANTRRFLTQGHLPPKDAVRIEELINYFHYELPAPAKGEPFSITTEVGPSPWNAKLKLVRIGLKAPAIDDAAGPRAQPDVPARRVGFDVGCQQAAAAQAGDGPARRAAPPAGQGRDRHLRGQRRPRAAPRPAAARRIRSRTRSRASSRAARPTVRRASSSPTTSPRRRRSRAASTA